MNDRLNERATSERERWSVAECEKGSWRRSQVADEKFRGRMRKMRKLMWENYSSSYVLSVQMLAKP